MIINNQFGNLMIAYTHGPCIDEPVAMTMNNSTYFYIPDIQGSIRAIIDMDGNTVATYQYDVWGNLVSYNGPLAEKNDYLYTGREYDWQSGIYYYRYRYYNPEIGRFMQSSWEHDKEMNMYVYVGNNPVNGVDPTGHPFMPPILPDHGGGTPNYCIQGTCLFNKMKLLCGSGFTWCACFGTKGVPCDITGITPEMARKRCLKYVNTVVDICQYGLNIYANIIPVPGAPGYGPIIRIGHQTSSNEKAKSSIFRPPKWIDMEWIL